jgi:transcriptional regulator with XRE-family HTH domain
VDAKQKEARQKELRALKQFIGRRLRELKAEAFPDGISDIDFEDATGVSRGSFPALETGTEWPKLDTLYLVVTGCRSSLPRFFQSPSEEYKEETRPLHHKLEYILGRAGTDHWLIKAIDERYHELLPPERKIPKVKRAKEAEEQEARMPGDKHRHR